MSIMIMVKNDQTIENITLLQYCILRNRRKQYRMGGDEELLAEVSLSFSSDARGFSRMMGIADERAAAMVPCLDFFPSQIHCCS
mmetsp:Transcript_18790/g.24654  ORF Transcript_18790/g.24654 Transcript_18790/m.24654 type:complete len:84 (+) Transcript_18790:259-510(+)